MSLPIEIHADLSGKAELIVAEVGPVVVRAESEALLAEIRGSAERLREEHEGKPPSKVPGVDVARKIYRSLGIDPTKHRPSSEALLRRVLKGKPFPKVNTLVDTVNLLSLRLLLCYGLYDRSALQPPITFRLGGPGEGHAGIRKDRVNLEGRPALFDAEGPFGNPTSDSDRAKITLETTSALVVCFAPPGLAAPERERIAAKTVTTIGQFCGETA